MSSADDTPSGHPAELRPLWHESEDGLVIDNEVHHPVFIDHQALDIARHLAFPTPHQFFQRPQVRIG